MNKPTFTESLKQKIKAFAPGRYLRELSVVIIGVAITFFISDLITKSKERKDLNIQLNMIYNELENNILLIDDVVKYYDNYLVLHNYLRLYAKNPEQNYSDSIKLYSKYAFSGISFSYQKAAYEMFINSGITKLFHNRQLLLDISECYLQLEDLKIQNDKHVELKYNEYSKFYSNVDKKMIGNDHFDLTDPLLSSLFNFHAINNGLGKSARRVKTQIEDALIKNKEAFSFN